MKLRAKAPDMFTKSIHRLTLDGPMNGAQRMKVPFKPTQEHPLILSPSEMSDFLRCRLRWNWRYRVGLMRKGIGGYQGIGIIISDSKEGWYGLKPKKRTVTAMEKIVKRVLQKDVARKITSKDRDLARAMCIGYAEWALGDHDESDAAIGKGIVKAEYPFCLPLDEKKTIWIRGKLDEFFEPTIYRNTLAMDETKTRGQISFSTLDLNHQMTSYLWAMWTEFPKFKRYIAWRTILRRQMPGPRVKARLFAREDVERSPDELNQWRLDTLRQARDILDAAIYPTFTESCAHDCDFFNLCLVRSDPADVKAIIKSEFIRK